VAIEEIIFLAAWAVGTLEAADEKHRYRRSDEQSEDGFMRREPVNQAMHSLRLHTSFPFPVN